MTAAPLPGPPPHPWPPRLLTVEEYLDLDESEYRCELYEGQILVSPSPQPRHSKASRRLANAVEAVAGPGFEVYEDVDLDLQLSAAGEPGFVPRPDVVVVRAEEARRVDEHGGVPRASGAVIVMEIVSPRSTKMDRVVKRDAYADAGIPC